MQDARKALNIGLAITLAVAATLAWRTGDDLAQRAAVAIEATQ